MLQFITKLINRFNYFITTYFISSNKDYHSSRNPCSIYQTCPNINQISYNQICLISLIFKQSKQMCSISL